MNVWEFWVKAGSWSHDEAAVILGGDIPAESDEQVGRGEYMPIVDIYGAWTERDLIARSFPKGRIEPKSFFKWCKERSLHLNPDLVLAASKIKSLGVAVSDFSQNTSVDSNSDKVPISPHWRDGRYDISRAALQTLETLNRETSKDFFKPNGGLNINKVVDEIDKNRDTWPALEKSRRGASTENIKKTLRDIVAGRAEKSDE
jgi:hypothetical protein